jgi:hypothetical protein
VTTVQISLQAGLEYLTDSVHVLGNMEVSRLQIIFICLPILELLSCDY